MVWALVPTPASGTTHEGSKVRIVFAFKGAFPKNAIVDLVDKGRGKYFLLSRSNIHNASRYTESGLVLRKRRHLPREVYAENKGLAPVPISELFGITRKTASSFANAASEEDIFTKTGSNKTTETKHDSEIDSSLEAHADISPITTELSEDQNSPPKLRSTFWKSVGNSSPSLDATPLAPVPPFTGGLISVLGLVLVLGVLLDRWIGQASKRFRPANTGSTRVTRNGQLIAPTGVAVFLEQDLKKKESVEWVNMVLGKLWKVYRLGLEGWIVGLLQPIIDNLQKPGYVERVQIKQFYLGDEPISVRSVERRASRHANDLQYHIGLRYTGNARMLLHLKLKAGFIRFSIPVGVRGLDVDGELWVKLNLVPSEPWVGTATWAFVSLPKIKLDLSPFRLFNLMAIPFLSVFLTKLLTQDLPSLFVRPNKNVIDFLKGRAVGPESRDFKGASPEGNKDFAGELSVTLVDARKLSYIPYGKTDPYVVFVLGDQVIKSKRNTQTTVYGPPGSPIWNQDFQLLVVDPKTQSLVVQVRDYLGFTTITVGVGEVDLSYLQDTVPTDQVVKLTGGWGPFKKPFAGEVLLRLTYTAYVEDEEDEKEPSSGYMSESNENVDPVPLLNEVVNKVVQSSEGENSIGYLVAAVIAEMNNETLESRMEDEATEYNSSFENRGKGKEEKTFAVKAGEATASDGRTAFIWLSLITGLVILVDISLNFSNLLNP